MQIRGLLYHPKESTGLWLEGYAMKCVAGAVVVLAGAVLFGAGIIAKAIMVAANQQYAHSAWAEVGITVVLLLGLVGLVVLVRGLRQGD
jgi:hypothetical protein